MSASAILWIILSMEVVGGLAAAWMAGENPQLAAVARQATGRSGPVGVAFLLLGGVSWILWLAYSIAAHDWRFIGMASVPVLVQVVRRIVGRRFTATPTPILAGGIGEKVTVREKPFRLIQISAGGSQGVTVTLQDEATLTTRSRWSA